MLLGQTFVGPPPRTSCDLFSLFPSFQSTSLHWTSSIWQSLAERLTSATTRRSSARTTCLQCCGLGATCMDLCFFLHRLVGSQYVHRQVDVPIVFQAAMPRFTTGEAYAFSFRVRRAASRKLAPGRGVRWIWWLTFVYRTGGLCCYLPREVDLI